MLLFLAIFIAFAFLVTVYVLIPYLHIQFYKRQGIETNFVPVFGAIRDDMKNVFKHNDYAYNWKKVSARNPKPKAIATNLGPNVLLLLNDPDYIKDFFQNPTRYEKSPIFDVTRMVNSTGLILAEGNMWKKHRKIIASAFQYQFTREMIPKVSKVAEKFCQKLEEKNDMNDVSILNEIQAITGETVGLLFFGENFGELKLGEESLTDFLTRMIQNQGFIEFSFSNTLFGAKFVRLGLFEAHRKFLTDVRTFRDFCQKVVEKRFRSLRESDSGSQGQKTQSLNMIDLFYDDTLNNSNDSLSEGEIVDELINFFSVGMDTAGHMITMASYYLIKNPRCQAKLLTEIHEFFSDMKSLTLEQLNKMDYMTAVLKETLRMAPPLPVIMDRISLFDHQIDDLKVKKGTFVNINLIGNHFDPRYHEDPEKFWPERWLDEGTLTMRSVKSQPFCYMPFAFGARNCIGQHFAMMEGKIILGMLLRQFEFELSDEKYEMRYDLSTLYEPHDVLKYKMKPRKWE